MNENNTPLKKDIFSDEDFEKDYKPYPAYGRPAKKRKSRKWLIVLIAIILLAAVAGAAYMFFIKPKPATNVSSTVIQSSKTPLSGKAADAVPTKHYDSTNFSLGLDYPNTWVLTDSDSLKLLVRSPAQNLSSAAGMPIQGEAIMTIQNKQTALPDFVKGSATAVLDSDKVAYTKPTQNQRANTYLSYLQYAATTTNGALDSIYITGDNGYKKGQDVPQADIIGVDPLVTISFVSCADTACANPKPLSITASSWQASALAKTAKAMLQSLSFN